MIPIELQPEPADFDENVRQRGRSWLANNGVEPDAPPPDPAALPPYWRRSNRQLWDAYSGVCAYLAIYFDWCTGAASTDHFVAKSRQAGDAYEWRNYRLSCLAANRNKNRFDDILDPVGLEPNTFVLDLATGNIRPNPRRVRLFFVGGRISLCGSEAGGNWIRHGVVREQRRGPVADGTCAVSDGWGCSAGTRALGGGSQYASMRRRPVAA